VGDAVGSGCQIVVQAYAGCVAAENTPAASRASTAMTAAPRKIVR
jgi:hypothetical protein